MNLLKCENCGSLVQIELWKKSSDNLVCPVCDKIRARKVNLEKIKVRLKKDEVKNEVVNSPKIEPKGFIDILDDGLMGVFGSAVSPCLECGKIICICSLKKVFSK